MFRLNFDISFGKDLTMSTDNIAARFEANKAKQANADALALRKLQVLDERFVHLREELNQLLTEKTEELNHDLRVGNILVVTFEEKQTRVSRKDTDDVLMMNFNPSHHSVAVKCDGAVRFDKTIQIEVNTGTGGTWLTLREGRKKDSYSLAPGPLGWLVDQAIAALLKV